MSDQTAVRPDQTLSDANLGESTPLSVVTLSPPAEAGTLESHSVASGENVGQSQQERLGRYEIHGEIGRGGMGAVLRGRDPTLGRDLAIKVLLTDRQGNADATRRFHEEAQIGGQLQHPGLVPVYELGTNSDGRPFFAMKLVDGQTLAALLKERQNPADRFPRFLTIFEQVCQALGYAHARGVIHRDLKPANVMVGAFGEVQVMDWGLAKVLGSKNTEAVTGGSALSGVSTVATTRSESGGSESRDGVVLGTPAYMPPEQARGEIDRLDQRSDVFGLGAILCEVLTGQAPFTGPNVSKILTQAANGDLTETCARLDACGADAELVRLTKICLAAEPDIRPRDGSEVAAQVAAYRAGVEERLRTAELKRAAAEVRAVEERRRRRTQLALTGSLLLLLTLGGGGGWYLRHQHVERLQEQTRHDAELREQRLERQAEQAQQETARVRREAEHVRAIEDDLGRFARAREERKWDEAGKRPERIEARLEDGGDAELRQRVSLARADLARVRKDQEMVVRLEEARLPSAGEDDLDGKSSCKRFEEAFGWYGLDVRQGSAEEVAARVAASSLREELTLSLARWGALAALSSPSEGRRLWAIAERADANAWRRQLFGAYLRADFTLARRLADEAKVVDLSPDSIALLALALKMANAPERAIALLQEGRQHYPNDFWLNFELAVALSGQSAEALRFFTVAQALRPNSVLVLYNLGVTLQEQGKWPEATAAYREAVRLKPDYVAALNNLGNSLREQGEFSEAEAACREAVRLKPDFVPALNNLGNALSGQGKFLAAEAAYRQAIRLKPEYHLAHCNLGSALQRQSKFPEAEAAFRESLRLQPNYCAAHSNLGNALTDQGRLPEAEAEFRTAIRLKSDDYAAHFNLGNTLKGQGKLPEAEAAYRNAIGLKSDFAGGYCNLGFVLRWRGGFEASRDAFRRCHELGSITPGWRYPSAQWLREAERLVELDGRLADVLDGKAKPGDAAEKIEFAGVCAYKHRHTAAVRLYAEAFQAEAGLANDLVKGHRYRAASYAVLAALGKDEGGKSLDEEEHTRLRNQALGWFRDDLTAWGKRLDSGKPKDCVLVASQMRQWQQDTNLAGVRDADTLVRLSRPELVEWQKFWLEVGALLIRAAEPK